MKETQAVAVESKARIVGDMFRHFLVMLFQFIIIGTAGVAVFDWVPETFRPKIQEDVLGSGYYEAREKIAVAKDAVSFAEQKKRSAELAVWAEKALERMRRDGGKKEGEFALRNAKASIDAALEAPLATDTDREFATYRLKRAVAEIPLDAMRKNVQTLEEVTMHWRWIVLAICVFATMAIAVLDAYSSPKAQRNFVVSAAIGALLGAMVSAGIIYIYVDLQIKQLL